MPRFRALDPLLLRIATLPAEDPTASRHAVWLGADFQSASADEIVGYLRAVADDPVFREAVAVSSDVFSQRLARAVSGEVHDHNRLTRTAYSAAKYALRLSARPTPFGIFAGVAPADAGSRAAARVGGAHRKYVRPDAGWLTAAVAEGAFASEAGPGREVTFVANDLCFSRGDRLHSPWSRTVEDGTVRMNHVSVALTPLVRRLWELAARPVTLPALLRDGQRRLRESGADGAEDVAGTVRRLVDNGYLLSSALTHTLTTEDLGMLAGAADDASLALIRRSLDAYAASPVGAGTDSLAAATSAMHGLRGFHRPPVQVDLLADADVTVPPAVTRSLEELVGDLWAISPRDVTPPHITRYAAAFVERYGSGVPVPVPEVIDPVTGLGYPEGYDTSAVREDHPEDPARASVLADLLLAAVAAGQQEVELDDAVLERLRPASGTDAPPSSVELCVQILAPDLRAIEDADFQILISRYSGSRTAGATAGRFSYLTGQTEGIRRLLGRQTDDGPLYAQLRFDPSATAALNLGQVPDVLPYQLPVGLHHDPDDPGVIDWRDLAFTSQQGVLRLVRSRDGREVVPVSANALNLRTMAPSQARLLCEISESTFPGWQTWNWGALGKMPFLPRVRRGRTVIQPAWWRPSEAMERADLPWPRWKSELAAWRAKWRVPRHVQIVVADEVLPLDLDNSLHQGLLRREIGSRTIRLSENLTADPGCFGWLDGHAHEIVVPFGRPERATRTAPVLLRHPSPARDTPVTHGPGGEWLYLKARLSADAQDEFLSCHLPPLVNSLHPHIDRWFYVRYADPEPELRLRFHGEPRALCDALPDLHRTFADLRERRLLGDVVVDTYRPEADRYGGPEAIDAAEELFTLDSHSAILQLRLRADGRLTLPDELLAAVNHGILLDALVGTAWCAWAADAYPNDPETRKFYRRNESAVKALVQPGACLDRFTELTGTAAFRDVWAADDTPSAYAKHLLVEPPDLRTDTALRGMLHMQHNRLIGINREKEARAQALLRGIARAHLGAQRHRHSVRA
ncbi:lantibiotic dehydratase [Streptomyces sp. NPDC094466]|uniref:lantibiotic dehydratase n=1 Tax=Streptomyces sp. NPDC094466 TaxID=3366065 RepID=UPI00380D2686